MNTVIKWYDYFSEVNTIKVGSTLDSSLTDEKASQGCMEDSGELYS